MILKEVENFEKVIDRLSGNITSASHENLINAAQIGQKFAPTGVFASPDNAAIIHVSGDHHVPMVLNRLPQFCFSSLW